MSSANDRQKNLCAKLENLERLIGAKELKRYKLHLLKRLSNRLPELTLECQPCDKLFMQVEERIEETEAPGYEHGHQNLREMKTTIQKLLKHLEKEHNIVEPQHYQGQYMAMGIGIGLAIGAAMNNTAIGMSLGIAIGLAIGSSEDSRAEKENRVI